MIQGKEYNNTHERTLNGIVHAGFSEFSGFVARKKNRCKLIGNHLVIPHYTQLANVCEKQEIHLINTTIRIRDNISLKLTYSQQIVK